jgi:hypothetical protein
MAIAQHYGALIQMGDYIDCGKLCGGFTPHVFLFLYDRIAFEHIDSLYT